MRRILLAFFAILIFCSVGAAEIKNSPDGFRGIKWGSSPSALGKYTFISHVDGLSIYTKDDDKLKIGNVDLTVIAYAFFENKLTYVFLKTEGFSNGEALKRTMIARYGEPDLRPETTKGSYLWHDRNATILFSHDANNECSAIIANTALFQAQQKRQDEEAQRGAKDF